MAWQQCYVCFGHRTIIRNGESVTCPHCRGVGQVLKAPPKPVKGRRP
jgi:DnaJ-class molecular chaperone